MDSLNFNSVVIDKVAMLPSIETLPNLSARAAFQVNSSAVFKEDVDIVPVIIDDTLSYMPWGGDNNMPFDILKLIDGDFNALRPVLITDSTSEIADDPEKHTTVKFAWRYAENRIAQRNPLGVGIFTEPYDYTFR